ncbi:hypothetical protein BASA81_000414 [Batrachochytrium salamandrivorans]|nr:hypothetical protein BASA81_000414 [Batrachochytrium salamandrivorans]
MILAVLVVNDAGQARLVRWYEPVQGDPSSILRRVFISVSRRGDRLCNFLEADPAMGWKRGTKIIYRHYATLYFIFVVEETESELGILDLIQVFVETLDRCFESVCELDLIFHSDRVHNVLDEVIQGGLVLETNMGVVLRGIDDMSRMERQTVPAPSPLFVTARSSSAFQGLGNTPIASNSTTATMTASSIADYLSPHLAQSTSNMVEMGTSLAQRASSYFS